MTAVITLLADPAEQIAAAFDGTELETVAFGYCGRLEQRDRRGLIVRRAELVPDAGYRERSAGHFSLQPAYVAEAVLRAAETGESLVIVHSHPGSAFPPDFSHIDERMHRTLVPSMLRQLHGPVGSLVRSPAGWNGRIWMHADAEERVALIRIAGRHLDLQAPGARDASSPDPQFDRQIRAFGEPLQRRLGRMRVGIVGYGGTGSLAGQWLAHLGVQDFLIVEPDLLEDSNRSRLVGARAIDAVGTPKVAIARRTIAEIRPSSRVETLQADVTGCAPLRALAGCDVVLCCTDSHASRAAINPLPYQYGVPVLDVGTLLRSDQGGVRDAHAELRLVTIGRGCLRCQGAIDPERVRVEMLSDDEREEQIRFGYTPGIRMPAPSVLPLNAFAVSLMTLRLFDLLEPWVDWDDRVNVELRGLQVTERPSASRPGCDICDEPERLGRGDDYPLACRPDPDAKAKGGIDAKDRS